MPTAVQTRPESVTNDEKGWNTQPVHGNSKRLCSIFRNRNVCGQRATLVTTTTKSGLRARLTRDGLLPIYHCGDPRHIANAHKQITEINKV